MRSHPPHLIAGLGPRVVDHLIAARLRQEDLIRSCLLPVIQAGHRRPTIRLAHLHFPSERNWVVEAVSNGGEWLMSGAISDCHLPDSLGGDEDVCGHHREGKTCRLLQAPNLPRLSLAEVCLSTRPDVEHVTVPGAEIVDPARRTVCVRSGALAIDRH